MLVRQGVTEVISRLAQIEDLVAARVVSADEEKACFQRLKIIHDETDLWLDVFAIFEEKFLSDKHLGTIIGEGVRRRVGTNIHDIKQWMEWFHKLSHSKDAEAEGITASDYARYVQGADKLKNDVTQSLDQVVQEAKREELEPVRPPKSVLKFDLFHNVAAGIIIGASALLGSVSASEKPATKPEGKTGKPDVVAKAELPTTNLESKAAEGNAGETKDGPDDKPKPDYFAEYEKTLEKIKIEEGHDYSWYMSAGRKAQAKGEHDRAVRLYQKAHNLKPNWHSTVGTLGGVFTSKAEALSADPQQQALAHVLFEKSYNLELKSVELAKQQLKGKSQKYQNLVVGSKYIRLAYLSARLARKGLSKQYLAEAAKYPVKKYTPITVALLEQTNALLAND